MFMDRLEILKEIFFRAHSAAEIIFTSKKLHLVSLGSEQA